MLADDPDAHGRAPGCGHIGALPAGSQFRALRAGATSGRSCFDIDDETDGEPATAEHAKSQIDLTFASQPDGPNTPSVADTELDSPEVPRRVVLTPPSASALSSASATGKASLEGTTPAGNAVRDMEARAPFNASSSSVSSSCRALPETSSPARGGIRTPAGNRAPRDNAANCAETMTPAGISSNRHVNPKASSLTEVEERVLAVADEAGMLGRRPPPSPVRSVELRKHAARDSSNDLERSRRQRLLPWHNSAVPDMTSTAPAAGAPFRHQGPTDADAELARQLQMEEEQRLATNDRKKRWREHADTAGRLGGGDAAASSSSAAAAASLAAASAAFAFASPRSRVADTLAPAIQAIQNRLGGHLALPRLPWRARGVSAIDVAEDVEDDEEDVAPVLRPPLNRRRRRADAAEMHDLHLAMMLQREEATSAASEAFARPEFGDESPLLPPRRRSRSRRRRRRGDNVEEMSQASLRRRLMQSGRDFTPEDYEMLSRLDEQASQPSAPEDHARRAQQEFAVRRLPIRTVAEAECSAEGSNSSSALCAGAGECSICMEPMAPGAVIKTLPCLHCFHRECIDRWLLMPGAVPRCPIDQVEIASGFV